VPLQRRTVPDCTQVRPGQQAWAGEHDWPTCGQVEPGWQVPPLQERPTQHSLVAVQAPSWGWQAGAAWHVPPMQ
jgi:hypothetical protein